MKKIKFYSVALSFLFCISAVAQVNIDHSIILTGTGSNAKVTGIQQTTQSTDAVNAQTLQYNSLTYAPASGTANAITVTLTPAPASYVAGMMVSFSAAATNTGAVSLNVNGLGTVPLKIGVSNDLSANDITIGQMVLVAYDGTNFQLLSGVNPNNLVFSLAAGTTQLAAGQSTSTVPDTLTVTYLSGNLSEVVLSVSGAPSGVTDILTPAQGVPSLTLSSVLVFTVQSSVAPGTYPMTVTATSAGYMQSISLTLTVLATKRVFISSSGYSGGNFGLSGADTKCQTLANNASLGGTWKAWLSTSTVNAKDRITDGAFVNNGHIVAFGIANLTSGSLINPINYTETGASSGQWAWTGTLPNGTLDVGNNCNDWSSLSTGADAAMGAGSLTNEGWTDAYIEYGPGYYTSTWDGCATSNPVLYFYCFEQ